MMLEFWVGFGGLIAYFLVFTASALLLRRRIAMPSEVFRKTLHIILLGSIFILTYAFTHWELSVLSALAFAVAVFPVLAIGERIPGYSKLLIERKRGEIKRSLIVAFGMFAVLVAIGWGWLGEKYLTIASVLAWGLGDAAAALVGKRFGRHAITGRLVEGRKSLEGTLAMFAVSFVAVMIVLLVNRPVPWYGYVPISLLAAAACAVVELYTRNGMDTLTCPLAVAAVLIPLTQLAKVYCV